MSETATCRGCNRVLNGEPAYRGGSAYDPITKERCKINFYGGFVCSAACDYRASLTQEQSMPGHAHDKKAISPTAQASHDRNWND